MHNLVCNFCVFKDIKNDADIDNILDLITLLIQKGPEALGSMTIMVGKFLLKVTVKVDIILINIGDNAY